MTEPLDDEAQGLFLQTLLDRGYKFKIRTLIAGKFYVWVEDPKGHVFLERIPLVQEQE